MRMGLGKSKIVVDVFHNSKYQRGIILAPKAVLNVWVGQFKRHCYDESVVVRVLDKSAVKNLAAISESKRDNRVVLVVNYEMAWRMDKALLAFHADMVVCDESHKIKTHDAKASKFAWRLGATAKKRLALTGTVCHNSPLDVYGQYRFLDQSIFGHTWTPFKLRYAVLAGPMGQWIVGTKNIDELKQKMQLCAFMATENDAVTLPPYTDTIIPCTLSASAKKVHDDLLNEMVATIPSLYRQQVPQEKNGKASEPFEDMGIYHNAQVVSVDNVLVQVLRLQQVSGGFVVAGGIETQLDDSKLKALGDLLDGMDIGEKVVVFAKFSSEIRAIQAAAVEKKFCIFELSGKVKQLNEFVQSKQSSLLAIQIQAGGAGIDLTCARYCVYYSTGYSLGDYEQSRARVHRPGQDRNVSYYHLQGVGTIDEDIFKAMVKKQDVATYLMEKYRHDA